MERTHYPLEVDKTSSRDLIQYNRNDLTECTRKKRRIIDSHYYAGCLLLRSVMVMVSSVMCRVWLIVQ